VDVSDSMCDEVLGDERLGEVTYEFTALLQERTTMRHEEVRRHDAAMCMLVSTLRGTEVRSFDEAKVWLLTCDSHLPELDARVRSGEDVPYCILTGQWMQVHRPLLPRSADFDGTLVRMLHATGMRPRGSVPPHLAYSILGRIAEYKHHSPEVAARILANRHFLETVRSCDGPEIPALVDNEMAKLATELLDERDEAWSEVDRLRERLDVSESRGERMEKDLDVLREDLTEERAARARRDQDLGRQAETLEVQLHTAQQLLRWVIAVAVWGALGVSVLLGWRLGRLSDIHQLAVAILLACGFFGALFVPLGKQRWLQVGGAIGAIATLAALLYLVLRTAPGGST